MCERDCPGYGTSWSCPPAVGTVEECRARACSFRQCFVFSTIAEVSDAENLEETLPTRMAHEEITRKVSALFREYYKEIITLSTESCDHCRKCTYPDAPCQKPHLMFPCVESYGILVTDPAEQGKMTFNNGNNIVTWFSVIFYDRK